MIFARNLVVVLIILEIFCPIRKVLKNHDLGKTSLPSKFWLVCLCTSTHTHPKLINFLTLAMYQFNISTILCGRSPCNNAGDPRVESKFASLGRHQEQRLLAADKK